MLRKVLTFLSLSFSAFGQIQDVELLAQDVQKDGDIVIANKNVVVYSQTYLITADRAIYDQANEIIELFGNVNMMKGPSEISRSNYAKLNLKNKFSDFEALFMMNKEMEVWLKSDESSSDDEYYTARKAIVSSCNVNDPDWQISASTAMLNKENKFLHMFNPVFSIGGFPVFYLPYFGFSTDTTRRTGLLPPEIGYSRHEGFYYKQPIYFAPYKQWDLELDPQIRTRRGGGVYGAFRFADSPYSKGEISFGFFEDREKYRDRQRARNSNQQTLKNKAHKGFGFAYDRDRLFKGLIDENLQEGLWIKATYLNDIDYLNLQDQSDDDYDSLVTSKLNYFLSGEDHYFGAYGKYNIDTQKIGNRHENKDTLQEYPSFQYHKFTDSILHPNLLYSVDAQSHNYTRRIGVTAKQYEFNAPISFHLPLFDDTFMFSFYENIYASHIDYAHKRVSQIDTSDDKDLDYIDNYHRFTLHTDLAKAYENFFHTINFGGEYILPGYQKGLLEDEFIFDSQGRQHENFLAKERKKEEMLGYATQYFYTSGGRKFLRHSISQGYYLEDGEYSDLKNSIHLYLTPNFSLYNRLRYSHIDKKFNFVQSGGAYSNDLFNVNLTHTVEKKSENKKDNYLTSAAGIKLPHHSQLRGGFQYDLQRNYTKLWFLGVSHNRKCWNYSITYRQELEPTTTTQGAATVKTHSVLFLVNFYPMGGIHYDVSYEQENGAK
ncbi:MAG: LPS-assembly protein LptD [Campylobacter sp.]|nr:LPS-assembly protein LptD [Campylobacter sp.]